MLSCRRSATCTPTCPGSATGDRDAAAAARLHGKIVFPGFPADVLFKFRLYSVINQLILWTTIGLAFGPLVERMLAPAPRPAADSEAAAAPTASLA